LSVLPKVLRIRLVKEKQNDYEDKAIHKSKLKDLNVTF